MHEPKEQSYLIMDTLVKTCRYQQVFTVLDSTLIKVLPINRLYSVYIWLFCHNYNAQHLLALVHLIIAHV